MGLYTINSDDEEIKLTFYKSSDDLNLDNLNEKTLILEVSEERKALSLSEFKSNYLKFLPGYKAEDFFKEACIAENLIPIKVEQSKDSYDEAYKTILKGEYIKRPDFYILQKDCFVEVKARSISKCFDNFFAIKKERLEAYKAFQKYSNKKLYFAVYTIDEESENRDVIKDSLAMIPLDYIDSENEYITENDKFFIINRKAFLSGLKLLSK